MPFVGLGAHIVFALFFAIHAIKNGKQLYWVVILFMFPLLGSIVYFFAEFLPSTRIERQLAVAGQQIARSFDPGRDLREAHTAFEVSATASNQMRLAHAMLDAGQADDAAQQFAHCLAGPFGSEPDVRIGAARAALARSNFDEAARLLSTVRQETPNYRAEDVLILLAQTYWANGHLVEAAATFREASDRDASVDTRAEHTMFAIATGDIDTARRLQRDIDVTVKTWNSYNKKLHKDVLTRLNAEWSKSGQSKTTT